MKKLIVHNISDDTDSIEFDIKYVDDPSTAHRSSTPQGLHTSKQDLTGIIHSIDIVGKGPFVEKFEEYQQVDNVWVQIWHYPDPGSPIRSRKPDIAVIAIEIQDVEPIKLT